MPLGGEEFFLLLPETDVKVAENIIEKVRKSDELRKIAYKTKDLSVTITFGI